MSGDDGDGGGIQGSGSGCVWCVMVVGMRWVRTW